VSTLDLFHRY